MFVTLGRNGGVGFYKGRLFGDFMVKRLKASNMMADGIWGDLGQKVPK